MNVPIVDLHCDLLFYLERDKKRTPYDHVVRCAIPQLRQGQVKVQILAIFTQSEPHSVENFLQQSRIYHELPSLYPKDFMHFSSDWKINSSNIAILPAIENASGFCNDSEPLQNGLKRLNNFITTNGKPLYISLTWNTENRFGGGVLSKTGLKEDGKRLLEILGQNQIPVDLSHASDALAYEMIEYIDGHNLNVPLIASHSNARAIASLPRNLPDEIAKEIFRRKGIIGFNLYRYFIGETEDDILKHFARWMELGGEDHTAFGSDFFYEADLPPTFYHGKEAYFKNYQDSSCYGKLMAFLQNELKLSHVLVDKFSHQNALSFIKMHVLEAV